VTGEGIVVVVLDARTSVVVAEIVVVEHSSHRSWQCLWSPV
jgi:hypothetical protein